MELSKLFVLMIIAGCFILGCDKSEPIKAGKIEPMTFSEIQTVIFNESCIRGCHDPNTHMGNLDLSPGNSYYNLIGVNSNGDSTKKRVDPFNSKKSYLIASLKGIDYAVIMPPFPIKPLDKDIINRVMLWIEMGAQNN